MKSPQVSAQFGVRLFTIRAIIYVFPLQAILQFFCVDCYSYLENILKLINLKCTYYSWKRNRRDKYAISRNTLIKSLLTNFFAIFQNCPKLCMHVEKDYTNRFSKFQVHKLRHSWNIHIQKRVIFGEKICYFCIPNFLRASDAVCNWLLIGQSQSVIVIVKSK